MTIGARATIDTSMNDALICNVYVTRCSLNTHTLKKKRRNTDYHKNKYNFFDVSLKFPPAISNDTCTDTV